MGRAYMTHAHAATTGGSWIVAGIALAMFAAPLVLVLLAVVRASREGGGEGDGPGSEGGGGSEPPRPRGPVDPDDGAAWWPEFERQFAAWVELSRCAEPVGRGRGAGAGDRMSLERDSTPDHRRRVSELRRTPLRHRR